MSDSAKGKPEQVDREKVAKWIEEIAAAAGKQQRMAYPLLGHLLRRIAEDLRNKTGGAP